MYHRTVIDCMSTVHQCKVIHDRGETHYGLHRFWISDTEPEGTMIDSLAS